MALLPNSYESNKKIQHNFSYNNNYRCLSQFKDQYCQHAMIQVFVIKSIWRNIYIEKKPEKNLINAGICSRESPFVCLMESHTYYALIVFERHTSSSFLPKIIVVSFEPIQRRSKRCVSPKFSVIATFAEIITIYSIIGFQVDEN